MSKELVLELPWPPSVNMLWRAVPRRGMILSRCGRDYRELALAALADQTAGRPPMTGRLEVLLEAFPPDRRTVWVDDEQIDDLRILRRGVCSPAKVVLRIRELPSGYDPGMGSLNW
jgi:Holliday junction resolvase RusA-like endonuclease